MSEENIEAIPTSPEHNPEAPDLVIVLGKNMSEGYNAERIQRDNFHLSNESRVTAIAAGQLFVQYPKVILLFTGGKTAGQEVMSEARAMAEYVKRKFPGIPDENIILEEEAIDTADNAERVGRILEGSHFERIGLLTTGYHSKNATTLFERLGVPIDSSFISEEILKTRTNSKGEPSLRHQAYVEHRANSDRIKKEKRKESIRTLLLATVDRKGRLLRIVTNHMRK